MFHHHHHMSNKYSQFPTLLDLSIRLDYSLNSGQWKTLYNQISFHFTTIHSTNRSSSTIPEAAKYNAMDLRSHGMERG
jgi:hypothetical protein